MYSQKSGRMWGSFLFSEGGRERPKENILTNQRRVPGIRGKRDSKERRGATTLRMGGLGNYPPQRAARKELTRGKETFGRKGKFFFLRRVLEKEGSHIPAGKRGSSDNHDSRYSTGGLLSGGGSGRGGKGRSGTSEL